MIHSGTLTILNLLFDDKIRIILRFRRILITSRLVKIFRSVLGIKAWNTLG